MKTPQTPAELIDRQIETLQRVINHIHDSIDVIAFERAATGATWADAAKLTQLVDLCRPLDEIIEREQDRRLGERRLGERRHGAGRRESIDRRGEPRAVVVKETPPPASRSVVHVFPIRPASGGSGWGWHLYDGKHLIRGHAGPCATLDDAAAAAARFSEEAGFGPIVQTIVGAAAKGDNQ